MYALLRILGIIWASPYTLLGMAVAASAYVPAGMFVDVDNRSNFTVVQQNG